MGGNIALFHPEGNFPNNPHLSGLLELLLERGHTVHVYCAWNSSLEHAQRHPRLFVHPVPPPPGPWEYLRGVLAAPDAPRQPLRWLALKRLPRFSLVLGVDLGIVEAAVVARAQGVPHGLLSYELFFAEETAQGFKRHEREACRGVSFAVCQDSERACHLARENGIPLERILTMPVAGRGAVPGARSCALHDALGLVGGVKIAVCIGSLDAQWSGTGQLIANVALWPEDWVLVLHHRYGAEGLAPLLADLDGRARQKIFPSPYASLPASELHRLLHACDLGLCFYTPTYDHPLQGKNLEHIGMASGKFTTYLQHGLPVLVNSQGEMGAHVRGEGLGWQVRDIGETHKVLAAADQGALDACRARCLEFFSRRCDLDVTSPPLLEAIDRITESPSELRSELPSERAVAAEPETLALCAAARLRLADGDAEGAVAELALGLKLADGAEDFEAAYAQALDLHRRGQRLAALAVYRHIHEDARVGAALAAWALFKSGEARLELGEGGVAREFFALALKRNPAHAKAALFLVADESPLAVRLVAQEAQEPDRGEGIAVPMDPLDEGLWQYYFSRRQPESITLRLGGPLSEPDAARLAGLLARFLAPGGQALVLPPKGAGDQAAVEPACVAAFAAERLLAVAGRAEAGLVIRRPD